MILSPLVFFPPGVDGMTLKNKQSIECKHLSLVCFVHCTVMYNIRELGDVSVKGLLMVVSKRWFEFSGGTKFRYHLFTSILPPFYLNVTSF